MARTNRKTRLRMEVLEVRRVLTTAPTPLGVVDLPELFGPSPVAELPSDYSDYLTQLFIETTTATLLDPAVALRSWVDNNSTFGIDTTSTQLIVPDAPLVTLGNSSVINQSGLSSFLVFDANTPVDSSITGSSTVIRAVANQNDNHHDSQSSHVGGGFIANVDSSVSDALDRITSTVSSDKDAGNATVGGVQQTVDIQPTLLLADVNARSAQPTVQLRPLVIDLFAGQFVGTTGVSADGVFDLQRQDTSGGPPPAGSLWSTAGGAPGNGQPVSSLFDVKPSRVHLDVTDLPGGPTDPAAGMDGGSTAPNPTDAGDNGPQLGSPEDSDPPQATAFVTVDIGTNHPETDNGFMGVDVVVNKSLQSRVEPLDKRQQVVSEIDMSRQHRLQLAAAASLPAPINAASGDDYSRVTPQSPISTALTATDLVFVVGRELASDRWFDEWVAEVKVANEEADSSDKRVADERREGEDSGLPASDRAELLIDSHSRSEQPARSRWQWAVDALLASAGIGAMVFYDRYGQLAEEKREFRIRGVGR